MSTIITKWLLTLDNQNNLTLTPKEVYRFMPVNRVMGQQELYPIEFVIINNTEYLCTYDHIYKSFVLVSKVNPDEKTEGLVTLEDQDKENMPEIAEMFLTYSDIPIN